MMLGLNGRTRDLSGDPLDVDVFAFHLAHQLGLSLREVESMPHAEYIQWHAYFTALRASENLQRVDG